MVQKAVVESTDGKYARISVSRKGMCDGCHKMSCGEGCPMSSLISSGKEMTADAVNEIGAVPGDTVMVESPDAKVLGAAAAVFIMPLVFGIVCFAVAAAFGAGEMIAALCALGGFVLAMIVLRIINGIIQKKGPTLVIVKIIEKDGHSHSDEDSTV